MAGIGMAVTGTVATGTEPGTNPGT
jgi:hypothetical protein